MGDSDLQLLIDKQVLNELVVRYCRAVDRVDEELLIGCFHEDAVFENGPFTGTVFDYIEKHRAGSWSGEKLTHRVQHAITNVLFEVDGDTAWGETYVEVRRMPPGQLFVEGVARQIDRFERRNGEWRIAHRRIVLEYVGPDHDFSKFPHGSRDRNDPSYDRA
jgi:hypothetical protein